MRQTLPISVVIPAFNRAPLLREALESVLAQDSAPSEILIIDDGSTEDVGTVAEEFGARVIRQADSGVSAARNAGIAGALSPWIAFLDSDDVWEPEKLTVQWQAVRASPQVGFVFSELRWVGAAEIPQRTGIAENAMFRAMRKTTIAPDVAILDTEELLRTVCRTNIVQTSGILMRTELARMVTFDNGLRHCEDHDFALRSIGRTCVAVVTKPMLRYRDDPAGVTGSECDMTLGALALSHRIFSQPYRYPAPIPDEYKARMWYLHRRAGAALLRAGRMSAARRHLISSLKRHPTAIAFAGLVATFVPWAVPKRRLRGA